MFFPRSLHPLRYNDPMKFIADAMLGSLARRLRLLGFDVLYDPQREDNEIIRVSLEEDRVILTRDTRLASRPIASKCILIMHDRVPDQVLQVMQRTGETPSGGELTRCSRCNHPLRPAEKEQVRDLVPAHVYAIQKRFYYCEGCGKVYWRGSHVLRMVRQRHTRDR